MAYVVPQVLISQLISEVSNNTVKSQNVLVFGPNYELYRYSEAGEKDKAFAGSWDGEKVVDASGAKVDSEGAVGYPNMPSDTTADVAYTKVFADNAFLKLKEFSSVEGFKAIETDQSSEVFRTIRFPYALRAKPDGTGRDGDVARDIAVGDGVAISYGTSKLFARIIGIASNFEDESSDNWFTDVEIDYAIPSGAIEAESGWSDEDSNDLREADFGSGVKITLCAVVDGCVVKGVTAGADKVTLPAAGLKADYLGWGAGTVECDILSADLYIQYRALLKTNASGIESLGNAAYVAATLGTVHPDNPLAFGAYMALLNSGDRVVYYCAVPSDDEEGYDEVLRKASLTDEVYMLVPLTRKSGIIEKVKGHVEAMSRKEKKLWRIGFVSQDVPETDMVYDETSSATGSPYVATFSNGTMQFRQIVNGVDVRPDTSTKCLVDLAAGDIVNVYGNDGALLGGYPITSIVDNNTVKVANAELSGRYKVEVYKALTHQGQVRVVADQSSRLATRRMYNVFPNVASSGGVTVTGEFIASAVAGLVSSVLPQQPVTNVALNGIDDVPLVYQTYSSDDLDAIAAGGTLIVMQDRPGSTVYVRHQISTAYKDNNLLTAELSVTKNLDSISYYFADMFAPFIGKYNVTPELVDVVRSKLEAGLASLESSTAAGLYGPQVIEDGTEIVSIVQDPVNKDHIRARVRLNLPVPFNYFDLDLEI